MTDSIDLDEMDVGDDEEAGNRGDWFWREEGEPGESAEEMSAVEQLSQSAGETTETTEQAGSTRADEEDRVPGVPQFSDGPAGMPEEQGGAGAGSGSSDPPAAGGQQGQGTAEAHGIEEPADMTMAMTYKAAHYFEDPQVVFADAHGWADWVGIVGEVSTPAIRKLQRDEGLELDFFGGSDTGPAERLAEVDEESMFFADRLVLVGVDGDDEWMAEEAGWEFIPLEEAAEKADWRLKPDLVD